MLKNGRALLPVFVRSLPADGQKVNHLNDRGIQHLQQTFRCVYFAGYADRRSTSCNLECRDGCRAPLLPEERVTYFGQPVAMIAADSLSSATDAAELLTALLPGAKLGPPGKICSSLFAAISTVAVSSSRGATGRTRSIEVLPMRTSRPFQSKDCLCWTEGVLALEV